MKKYKTFTMICLFCLCCSGVFAQQTTQPVMATRSPLLSDPANTNPLIKPIERKMETMITPKGDFSDHQKQKVTIPVNNKTTKKKNAFPKTEK